ncbi:uncharacterized protein MONOS_5103 [Monocercomonoides exilis]|uniref:uncharacterized protein n=1 Tax=Monocercomonoides exilis TaxID=2049356 RepID=UPI00355A426A|nr:hypothetical protein MONOS_5103 [Monocercomonoides exilis]|eukprot:MONOS_5103.1-p1 / transcript=MONOS_5103.1 / gene=MONOS_5103 / organism=Monocercomonoides_exilis_PA203 / gene_product=unspecified product / transcript_product=unspecified product / location=Mono_scaffold00145:20986-24147(-) / protein_length=939 / sequence_SO=supercontig / SO=protein_coding / is_pseudo=false
MSWRDDVTEKLRQHGVLTRMRNELKAAVLLALKDKEQEIPGENEAMENFQKDSQYIITLSLIYEALTSLGLKSTASVFLGDTQENNLLPRDELIKKYFQKLEEASHASQNGCFRPLMSLLLDDYFDAKRGQSSVINPSSTSTSSFLQPVNSTSSFNNQKTEKDSSEYDGDFHDDDESEQNFSMQKSKLSKTVEDEETVPQPSSGRPIASCITTEPGLPISYQTDNTKSQREKEPVTQPLPRSSQSDDGVKEIMEETIGNAKDEAPNALTKEGQKFLKGLKNNEEEVEEIDITSGNEHNRFDYSEDVLQSSRQSAPMYESDFGNQENKANEKQEQKTKEDDENKKVTEKTKTEKEKDTTDFGEEEDNYEYTDDEENGNPFGDVDFGPEDEEEGEEENKEDNSEKAKTDEKPKDNSKANEKMQIEEQDLTSELDDAQLSDFPDHSTPAKAKRGLNKAEAARMERGAGRAQGGSFEEDSTLGMGHGFSIEKSPGSMISRLDGSSMLSTDDDEEDEDENEDGSEEGDKFVDEDELQDERERKKREQSSTESQIHISTLPSFSFDASDATQPQFSSASSGMTGFSKSLMSEGAQSDRTDDSSSRRESKEKNTATSVEAKPDKAKENDKQKGDFTDDDEFFNSDDGNDILDELEKEPERKPTSTFVTTSLDKDDDDEDDDDDFDNFFSKPSSAKPKTATASSGFSSNPQPKSKSVSSISSRGTDNIESAFTASSGGAKRRASPSSSRLNRGRIGSRAAIETPFSKKNDNIYSYSMDGDEGNDDDDDFSNDFLKGENSSSHSQPTSSSTFSQKQEPSKTSSSSSSSFSSRPFSSFGSSSSTSQPSSSTFSSFMKNEGSKPQPLSNGVADEEFQVEDDDEYNDDDDEKMKDDFQDEDEQPAQSGSSGGNNKGNISSSFGMKSVNDSQENQTEEEDLFGDDRNTDIW